MSCIVAHHTSLLLGSQDGFVGLWQPGTDGSSWPPRSQMLYSGLEGSPVIGVAAASTVVAARERTALTWEAGWSQEQAVAVTERRRTHAITWAPTRYRPAWARSTSSGSGCFCCMSKKARVDLRSRADMVRSLIRVRRVRLRLARRCKRRWEFYKLFLYLF